MELSKEENHLISFIQNKENKQLAIAHEYFQLILHHSLYSLNYNWAEINKHILNRYKTSGLIRIKEMAWKKFDEV